MNVQFVLHKLSNIRLYKECNKYATVCRMILYMLNIMIMCDSYKLYGGGGEMSRGDWTWFIQRCGLQTGCSFCTSVLILIEVIR